MRIHAQPHAVGGCWVDMRLCRQCRLILSFLQLCGVSFCTLLTCTCPLQGPRIPLVESIFHGANADQAEDCRVVTGRTLSISLGEDGAVSPPARPLSAGALKKMLGIKDETLKLQKLLWMHFFEGWVPHVMVLRSLRVFLCVYFVFAPTSLCERETDKWIST